MELVEKLKKRQQKKAHNKLLCTDFSEWWQYTHTHTHTRAFFPFVHCILLSHSLHIYVCFSSLERILLVVMLSAYSAPFTYFTISIHSSPHFPLILFATQLIHSIIVLCACRKVHISILDALLSHFSTLSPKLFNYFILASDLAMSERGCV